MVGVCFQLTELALILGLLALNQFQSHTCLRQWGPCCTHLHQRLSYNLFFTFEEGGKKNEGRAEDMLSPYGTRPQCFEAIMPFFSSGENVFTKQRQWRVYEKYCLVLPVKYAWGSVSEDFGMGDGHLVRHRLPKMFPSSWASAMNSFLSVCLVPVSFTQCLGDISWDLRGLCKVLGLDASMVKILYFLALKWLSLGGGSSWLRHH